MVKHGPRPTWIDLRVTGGESTRMDGSIAMMIWMDEFIEDYILAY